jgi:hypothetical protein
LGNFLKSVIAVITLSTDPMTGPICVRKPLACANHVAASGINQ